MRGATRWFAQPPKLIVKESSAGLLRDPRSLWSLVFGSAELEAWASEGTIPLYLGIPRKPFAVFPI